ncbi:hypothetical protein Bbelb_428240 [Branchiostoma belcheri]|nr:hypothetical protein Bbelb_428240 [Branchiostoma belcheri]
MFHRKNCLADSTVHADGQGKAEALSQQYDSVFTNENVGDIPSLGTSPYEDMPQVEVTLEGVRKLLEGINPVKASGPDLLPCRLEYASTVWGPHKRLHAQTITKLEDKVEAVQSEPLGSFWRLRPTTSMPSVTSEAQKYVIGKSHIPGDSEVVKSRTGLCQHVLKHVYDYYKIRSPEVMPSARPSRSAGPCRYLSRRVTRGLAVSTPRLARGAV